MRTIIEIHGGQLVLENRQPQPGLRAALVFSLGFKGNAALPHEIVVI
ncbi:sensor kinase [Bordetella pertussis]|nr:sensor kinase [Bordetella pertussis]CFU87519.1 sensor kinase [Bordetella pertussis]CPL76129.1 sensor kinase [Bordetella pertussis]CPM27614.1 sensor kinase [Bordetella pertussis]CPN79939.1 sensor kinase [Bordetella pertussis]